MTSLFFLASALAALATPQTDRDQVAQLDVAYQAAVKRNDAAAMDRILHPGFKLVLGDGKTFDRKHLLDLARNRTFTYELQDEEAGSQTVMVWGDTAIVTAKLRLKGTGRGQSFDYALWFSDTYVRTDAGWRYLFGQASLPLGSGQEGGQDGGAPEQAVER